LSLLKPKAKLQIALAALDLPLCAARALRCTHSGLCTAHPHSPHRAMMYDRNTFTAGALTADDSPAVPAFADNQPRTCRHVRPPWRTPLPHLQVSGSATLGMHRARITVGRHHVAVLHVVWQVNAAQHLGDRDLLLWRREPLLRQVDRQGQV